MKLADLILTYSPIPLSAVPNYLTSWQPGITPISTTPVVLTIMAAYLTTIFTIQHLLHDKQPYVLLTWFRAHNIVLSLGSALLFALMLEEIVPIVSRHGIRYAICDKAAWTPVRLCIPARTPYFLSGHNFEG
jgi:fatty acid elongase 3